MKYTSLQEYFYKFQNVLYLLILLPLLTFIILFVFEPQKPAGISEEQFKLIGKILIGLVLIDWLVVLILFHGMFRRARKLGGLGLKLERYYTITTVRFSLLSLAGLVLVAGFFLTETILFSVPLGLDLILFFVLWPRPSKVCSDLKLKGDEREMVYYKKMNL
jgi:hypothetical protein